MKVRRPEVSSKFSFQILDLEAALLELEWKPQAADHVQRVPWIPRENLGGSWSLFMRIKPAYVHPRLRSMRLQPEPSLWPNPDVR